MIGINTGLRVGDLLKLKVSDVKGKRKAIVKEGKTQKKRTIYLDSIYDEIQGYVSTLDRDWLFPSRKGDKAISPTQAYRQLNKVAEFAGVESVGNHTLKKSFGYWYYKQHKAVAELQKILNHSHPSITLRYIGITEEQIEDKLKTFKL